MNIPITTKNKKIDEDQFLRMRKDVLALWPTGQEVDLDEAVEYQKNLPETKNFHKVTEKLRREGRTVVFPRGGTPILEDMISLCRTLVESGVPFIPVTTDTFTRHLQFDRAQSGLEESIRTGKPVLNGYPLVNHGVKNTRKVVESCEGAFNPRVSSNGYPIGAEIGFASGMTGFSSGCFITFGAYEKMKTIEWAIQKSQYVWRLMGYYAERGQIISSDLHGWITCGVYPISVNVAAMIAEALMAAEQGAKSIIPLVHFEGNMAQDLAWLRVTPRLLKEYLERFGYKDAQIPGIFAAMTPLYPMPQGLGEAFGYITYTAMIAALGRAESVFLRTIDEGAGVPTEEAHALTYKSANWLFQIIREQHAEVEVEGTDEEERITEMEVRAIVEKLLDLGNGDIAQGCIRGVESGVIDSPFSPNKTVKDNVLGVKDSKGACRYAEFGNLPFPDEVKEFHRQRLAERTTAEKRKMDYYVSIDDFWAFSKGKLVGRTT